MAECCLVPASARRRSRFFAVLLQKIFPQRPVVVVAPDLKTQESFQQDIETWLALSRSPKSKSTVARPTSTFDFRPSTAFLSRLGNFSARRQTAARRHHQRPAANAGRACRTTPKSAIHNPKLVVTSVTALLQKTFPPGEIQKRTRKLQRGDKIDPLDLIEWLEEQGYEPEAQVTQKGEIALRGGILDVWPLTSPWPVRLEFFGDELESLRHFDPLTQISREEISEHHDSARRRIGNFETERGQLSASCRSDA